MHKVLTKILASLFPLFILSALVGLLSCVQLEVNPTTYLRPSLLVPLFKNTTFEPLLEKTLTPIFKTALYEGGWRINGHSDQVSKVLVGRITRFGHQPISLNPVGGAREYRINMSLKVALMDNKGGEERFSKTVEGVAEYIARSDSGADRLAKDRAIREAGRDMAEEVANLLQNIIDQETNGRE